jgi:hypothetical protein
MKLILLTTAILFFPLFSLAQTEPPSSSTITVTAPPEPPRTVKSVLQEVYAFASIPTPDEAKEVTKKDGEKRITKIVATLEEITKEMSGASIDPAYARTPQEKEIIVLFNSLTAKGYPETLKTVLTDAKTKTTVPDQNAVLEAGLSKLLEIFNERAQFYVKAATAFKDRETKGETIPQAEIDALVSQIEIPYKLLIILLTN